MNSHKLATIRITLTFTLMSLLMFLWLSCSNSSDPEPNRETKGSISGSITPVDAAISMSYSLTSGGPTTTLDKPNGTFQFDNITPGRYKVSLIPKVGYNKPADTDVNVEANKTASAGNFSLISNEEVSTISFNFGGDELTMSSPFASCLYNSPNFDLRGETSTSPAYWLIDINLKNVNGAGPYNATTSGSYIQVTHFTSAGVPDGNWMTSNGGSGQVVITSMNASTHIVSGSFTATLIPQGATGGSNKEVKNGTFTNFNF